MFFFKSVRLVFFLFFFKSLYHLWYCTLQRDIAHTTMLCGSVSWRASLSQRATNQENNFWDSSCFRSVNRKPCVSGDLSRQRNRNRNSSSFSASSGGFSTGNSGQAPLSLRNNTHFCSNTVRLAPTTTTTTIYFISTTSSADNDDDSDYDGSKRRRKYKQT